MEECDIFKIMVDLLMEMLFSGYYTPFIEF